MTLEDRIGSFEILGDILRRYGEGTADLYAGLLRHAAIGASSDNTWFTPEHIRIALNNLGEALRPGNVDRWIKSYRTRIDLRRSSLTVGVVMAGNIPAVGFHDMLCVLISGNRLVAKLSASDTHLLPALGRILEGINPGWKEMIRFTTETLRSPDAILATGSTNTSRYFEYYFRDIPHVIRRNRNGAGVLSGGESQEELRGLADDILLFFGLGCRNVSKLYVPEGYDFKPLIHSLGSYAGFTRHHKYNNNYVYNSSVFRVNGIRFTDTGFLLMKEDTAIASPAGVLYYEYYQDPGTLSEVLSAKQEQIQCVVSSLDLPINHVQPGQAQKPALWDYADGVDTMEFLLSLPDDKISL